MEPIEELIKKHLEIVAKNKGIPVDRVMIGMMNKDLYIWDYDSGRGHVNEFKVIEIIEFK